MINHTFVICAYKESKYLEDCIKSVLNQKLKSKVLIATSTDNKYIRSLAEKYNVELCIANHESDIARDWNFALAQADTMKYATEKEYGKILIYILKDSCSFHFC